MRTITLVAAAVGAVLALGCNKTNPNFCQGDQCTEIDAPIDGAPVTCSGNGPDPSCPAANPVCVDGECTGSCASDADCAGRPAAEDVCTTSGACGACDEVDEQADPIGGPEDECTTPTMAVCDGGAHACRPCESHSECTSGACDAGRCVPHAEVVHVATTGADGAACGTVAAPCRTLTGAIDRVEANAALDYIVLAPNSVVSYLARATTGNADFNNVDVYVVGVGASVERDGDGEILEMRGSSDVVLDGLTIKNATGTSGHAILCAGTATIDLRGATLTNNQGNGISGACGATLVRSTISQNQGRGIELGSNSSLTLSRSTISGNAAGGVSLSGATFRIVNNFIVGNGTITASTFGGLSVSSTGTMNVLEFNTVALNSSTVGSPDGISCNNAGLTARNNIVIGSLGKPHVDVGTNCMHAHSLFTPDTAPNGTQNMVIADQSAYMFVSGTDYHIRPGSAAAGRAQSTNLTGESLFDVDGDGRTADGATVDVGADEIP